MGAGRPLRPEPRARRPVRRAPGWTRPSPDRPVVLQSTDHHCAWVEHRGAAPGRHRRAHARPAGRRGRAARRRHPDGDAGRVDGDGPGAAARAAGDRGREARRAGRGRPRCSPPPGSPGCRRPRCHPADVAAYLATAAAGRLAGPGQHRAARRPGRWRASAAEFVAARAGGRARRRSPTGVGAHREVLRRRCRRGRHGGDAGAVRRPAARAAPRAAGVDAATSWPQPPPAFDADGFQLHIHAIGDAGGAGRPGRGRARSAAVNGPRDRRPVIAHTQLVDPADVPRFAELGVIANLEPLWAQLDPLQVDLTLPRLGPQRGAWQYPMASLLATGARALDGQRLAGQLLPPARRAGRRGHPADPRTAVPAGGWLPHERLPVGDRAVGLHRGRRLPGVRGGRAGASLDGRPPGRPGLARPRPHDAPSRWTGPRIAVRGTWLAGRRTWCGVA